MIPPATAEELLEIVRARVPRAWIYQCLSTPDGAATLMMVADMFAELDARDARRMSALFVAPHSMQVDEPASGAVAAATTLAIVRRRAGAELSLTPGTRCQTRDGHVFRTLTRLTFGAHELDVEKTVEAVAVVPGDFAVIPPNEITQFTPVANGLTGAGTEILNVAVGGAFSLRLTTDVTKPHPWRDTIAGLPIEFLSASGVLAPNVGMQAQIAKVTTGPAHADPPDTETAYAWTPLTDQAYPTLAMGAAPFVWAARDWNEVGFEVRNVTRATPGRDATIDALAEARGRPRRPGEGDESVRTRLRRKPLSPSARGILEQVVIAIAPFGFGRHDVRIYELGIVPVGDTSALAENYQPAGGWLWSKTCYGMATPHTPDAMAARGVSGATLSIYVNPGFVGWEGISPWVIVVRVTLPGGFDADVAAQIRLATSEAFQAARQRGAVAFLYNVVQWSYPP